MKPIPQPKIIEDARPLATSIAQTLIQTADAAHREHPQGEFCCVLAHLVYQNIAVNAALTVAEPGSAHGEKIIRDMFENSMKDTIEYWKSDYLKAHFGGN